MDELRETVEAALSLSHEILPQTIDDVIAIVREHDAPLIEARAVEREFDAWEAGCELGYTAGALGALPPPNPYGGDDA